MKPNHITFVQLQTLRCMNSEFYLLFSSSGIIVSLSQDITGTLKIYRIGVAL